MRRAIIRFLKPFLFVFLCIGLSASYAQTIKVAYFIVPPHVIDIDRKKNKPTGVAIDFFENVIAPEMGITVEWNVPSIGIPRQLKLLKEGKLDAGIIFAKNDERAQFLNYPDHSFYDSRSVLAVSKEHPLKEVSRIEDILEYRIGYSKKAFRSPFMRDERIKWDFVYIDDWIGQNFKKLISGRFDAMYVVEAPPILYVARKNKAENLIRLVYLPEPKTAIYTTFSKKSLPDLAQRYDRAFEKVEGQSKYYEMLSKYIDVNEL